MHRFARQGRIKRRPRRQVYAWTIYALFLCGLYPFIDHIGLIVDCVYGRDLAFWIQNRLAHCVVAIKINR